MKQFASKTIVRLLLAVLSVQFVAPFSIFADDTLRPQPPAQTKAGAEELQAALLAGVEEPPQEAVRQLNELLAGPEDQAWTTGSHAEFLSKGTGQGSEPLRLVRLLPRTPNARPVNLPNRFLPFLRVARLNGTGNDTAIGLLGFHVGQDGKPDQRRPVGWAVLYIQSDGQLALSVRDIEGRSTQEVLPLKRTKSAIALLTLEVESQNFRRFTDQLIYPRTAEEALGLALYLYGLNIQERAGRKPTRKSTTVLDSYRLGNASFFLPVDHAAGGLGDRLLVLFDQKNDSRYALVIPAGTVPDNTGRWLLVRADPLNLAGISKAQQSEVPVPGFLEAISLAPVGEVTDGAPWIDSHRQVVARDDIRTGYIPLYEFLALRNLVEGLDKQWHAIRHGPREQETGIRVKTGMGVLDVYFYANEQMVTVRRATQVYDWEGPALNQTFLFQGQMPPFLLNTPLQGAVSDPTLATQAGMPLNPSLLDGLLFSRGGETGIRLPSATVAQMGDHALLRLRRPSEDPYQAEVVCQGESASLFVLKAYEDQNAVSSQRVSFSLHVLLHSMAQIQGDPFELGNDRPRSFLLEAAREPQWSKVDLFYNIIFWNDAARPPVVVREDNMGDFQTDPLMPQSQIRQIINTRTLVSPAPVSAGAEEADTMMSSGMAAGMEEVTQILGVAEFSVTGDRGAVVIDAVELDRAPGLVPLIRQFRSFADRLVLLGESDTARELAGHLAAQDYLAQYVPERSPDAVGAALDRLGGRDLSGISFFGPAEAGDPVRIAAAVRKLSFDRPAVSIELILRGFGVDAVLAAELAGRIDEALGLSLGA